MNELVNNFINDSDYVTYKGEMHEINKDIIIATRHKCIYEWFLSKGIYGVWMPVVRNMDVRGKILCGANLPLHIVGYAKKGIIINISNDTDKPFEELTPEDIDYNCFHQVKVYEVQRTKLDMDDKEALARAITIDNE